jgi:hypothetical protein
MEGKTSEQSEPGFLIVTSPKWITLVIPDHVPGAMCHVPQINCIPLKLEHGTWPMERGT